MLSKVFVLQYPQQQALLTKLEKPARDIIVVTDNAPLKNLIKLFETGFEHCVQKNRADFAQELISSGFMAQRPPLFAKHPVSFFLNGFQAGPVSDLDAGRNIRFEFRSNTEKEKMLDRLGNFLDQSPQMGAVKDICLQAADELINNAIFAAPVDAGGMRINERADRRGVVSLPEGIRATLFSCFSDQKVLIGCNDPFGSLTRLNLLNNLKRVFADSAASVITGDQGAGLGFRYLVENSANFYVMATKGQNTLVACEFLLKGLKSNLSAAKHFHISFR